MIVDRLRRWWSEPPSEAARREGERIMRRAAAEAGDPDRGLVAQMEPVSGDPPPDAEPAPLFYVSEWAQMNLGERRDHLLDYHRFHGAAAWAIDVVDRVHDAQHERTAADRVPHWHGTSEFGAGHGRVPERPADPLCGPPADESGLFPRYPAFEDLSYFQQEAHLEWVHSAAEAPTGPEDPTSEHHRLHGGSWSERPGRFHVHDRAKLPVALAQALKLREQARDGDSNPYVEAHLGQLEGPWRPRLGRAWSPAWREYVRRVAELAEPLPPPWAAGLSDEQAGELRQALDRAIRAQLQFERDLVVSEGLRDRILAALVPTALRFARQNADLAGQTPLFFPRGPSSGLALGMVVADLGRDGWEALLQAGVQAGHLIESPISVEPREGAQPWGLQARRATAWRLAERGDRRGETVTGDSGQAPDQGGQPHPRVPHAVWGPDQEFRTERGKP